MAVIAGAVVLAAASSGGSKHEGLRDRLARAVRVDGADACEPTNGNLSVKPAKHHSLADVHPRFTAGARELILISCDELGPATLYVRFASHRALTRALRLPKRQRPTQVCTFEHELFDGEALDDGQLRRWCNHLHGALLL